MNRARHFQDLTLTPEQQDAFLARIAPQVSMEDYQIIEAMTRGVPLDSNISNFIKTVTECLPPYSVSLCALAAQQTNRS